MEIPSPPDRTRRPDVESLPITLADGNLWGLALPSPRLKPVIVEGVDALGRPSRTIRLESEFGYPLEIRRLVEDLRSACDRGGAERQFECLIRLAAALLRRAHDIEPADAVSLLEMAVDDLPGFVGTVLSVVSGECLVDPDSRRKVEVDG